MQRVSIAEARNNLSRLVHSAESGERVELTRRGKPVAILVAMDDYLRLIERPRAGFVHAIRELRARYAIGDDSDLDPAEVFPRDRTPGREFRYED